MFNRLYWLTVSLCVIAVLFSVPGLAATVNVVDYGAVGTGNEADAATNQIAFTAAIADANSGDTVYFPPGVYYLDGSVSVPSRGISVNKAGLTLDGYGATIKRVTSDATSLVMIGWGWGDNGSVIQGLTIDGNRSVYEGGSFGIYASHSTNLTIIDCNIINNASDGIYISAEHDDTYGPNYKKGYATIENCTINNNYRNGLSITNSSGGCVVKNSDFKDNDLHGLDIEPEWHHTSNHLITGCTFDNDRLSLYGTEPYARPWGITIEDCNFINGAELVSHLAMDITATNNTFTGAGGSIFFNGFYAGEDYGACGKIALTGNSVEGITNNGINLLVNPSFDSWTAGTADNWTAVGTDTYNIESSEARALEGVKAAHLSAAGGTAELKQTIAVSVGNYYTFGGYISRGPISGSTHPSIRVKFLNSGSSVLKTIELRAYYEYEKYDIYEKVMGIVEAPVDAVNAEVIVGSATSGSFDAYYDGLFFFEGVGPDGGDLTETDNKVMRFDFGLEPSPTLGKDSPAPGYIHVDSNTAYGYDANTGLTYGVFGDGVSEYSHASYQTRHTPTCLSIDGLRFDNADGLSSSGFELEVPNGTYLVTVAGGSMSVNLKGYLVVEGQTYSGDPNFVNVNLYMVDVIPEKDEGVPDGYLTWSQDQIYDKHAPVSSLFGIQTWGMGGAMFGPIPGQQELYEAAEFLYLQDQPITVTDGKLTVYGVSTTEQSLMGVNYLLTFLEIVAVSPRNCSDVQEFGFGFPGDFDQDCDIDLTDLAEIVNNWLGL